MTDQTAMIFPADRPAPAAPSATEASRLAARASNIANRMDNAVRIPGTRITLGWDAIVGLVPGIGDTLALAPGFYILHLAHRTGAPRTLLARMAFNLGVDWAVGLVPLVGDLLDIGYKANLRNAALMRADVDARYGRADR